MPECIHMAMRSRRWPLFTLVSAKFNMQRLQSGPKPIRSGMAGDPRNDSKLYMLCTWKYRRQLNENSKGSLFLFQLLLLKIILIENTIWLMNMNICIVIFILFLADIRYTWSCITDLVNILHSTNEFKRQSLII